MELVKKVLQGDEGSAARLISMIEEGLDEGYEAVSLIFPYTGKAHVIGVTGGPGAGKSTLINRLAASYGRQREKVGVIAVDPTSAKGDGAFLGDRVRMRDAERVEGTFIRSMAHRGFPGGIAKATLGAVYVLEGLGKGVILVESVGAGQTEMQVSTVCDSVITVLTPDYGDEIQLMKAGLIEIGDIVVMNKMDRAGAAEAAEDIALHLAGRKDNNWQIPVLTIQANKGEGIERLMATLDLHRRHVRDDAQGKSATKEKLKRLVLTLSKEEAWSALLSEVQDNEGFAGVMERLQNKEIDPYKAVRMVLKLALPKKYRKTARRSRRA
ncbi:MAG: methylmalonyl Co-A mutase-associated GTPase MeaB [Syntrophorhabdaceae bacterium]|jgi:LAO/AO transport system kinase|nr:methylmalonyl Co-A mutase-associated GTPase MeaB [Syntrophorhabdaceae bacterium]